MARREYYELNEFENIYLEDSYVLGVLEKDDAIEFEVDMVLTEKHPLYEIRPGNEQYCYRKAKIIFSEVQDVEWNEKRMEKFTDATGEVDYGNIDELYFENGTYYLVGDWGRVKIKSKQPEVRFLG